MVLRAWPRSTAANSTWLNLIGNCVGQQLRCEIIEGLQFRDRFQEFRQLAASEFALNSAAFHGSRALRQAKWVQACGGGLDAREKSSIT